MAEPGADAGTADDTPVALVMETYTCKQVGRYLSMMAGLCEPRPTALVSYQGHGDVGGLNKNLLKAAAAAKARTLPEAKWFKDEKRRFPSAVACRGCQTASDSARRNWPLTAALGLSDMDPGGRMPFAARGQS